MGQDSLSQAPASTSQWDAAAYAAAGSFVPALGAAALDLLAPQPGERILDVGCGDGVLTEQIVFRGAVVTGIDADASMVAAARARGLDVRLGDAEAMEFADLFDAAFSNAALHWMLAREKVAANVLRALKPGGRFAGEMGGEGNIARLQRSIDEELILRGYAPPVDSHNWYPSVEEFAALYEEAGFDEIDARLIERPTPVPMGIAGWVPVFRKGWLDRAGVPEEERPALAQGVAERFGDHPADYVRLRFIMRKPV